MEQGTRRSDQRETVIDDLCYHSRRGLRPKYSRTKNRGNDSHSHRTINKEKVSLFVAFFFIVIIFIESVNKPIRVYCTSSTLRSTPLHSYPAIPISQFEPTPTNSILKPPRPLDMEPKWVLVTDTITTKVAQEHDCAESQIDDAVDDLARHERKVVCFVDEDGHDLVMFDANEMSKVRVLIKALLEKKVDGGKGGEK